MPTANKAMKANNFEIITKADKKMTNIWSYPSSILANMQSICSSSSSVNMITIYTTLLQFTFIHASFILFYFWASMYSVPITANHFHTKRSTLWNFVLSVGIFKLPNVLMIIVSTNVMNGMKYYFLAQDEE